MEYEFHTTTYNTPGISAPADDRHGTVEWGAQQQQQQEAPIATHPTPLHRRGHPTTPPQSHVGGGAGAGGQDPMVGAVFQTAMRSFVTGQSPSGTEAMDMFGNYIKNKDVEKYVAWFDGLRVYFNVTNSYVLQKLKALLFPFGKSVRNLRPDSPDLYSYEPTSERISVDLYIPTMALITYVLLSAALMGAHGTFRPEVLGTKTSSSILLLLLEVIVVQAGCYLIGTSRKVTFLDSIAFCGYKFVGICLTMLLYSVIPIMGVWYISLVWFALCSGLVLKEQLSEKFSNGEGKVHQRAVPFLWGSVAWQLPLYFLQLY